MAHVMPFRGVLYNQTTIGKIDQVVAPPYDIIDADKQNALYTQHPHNIVRLELGKDEPNDTASNNRYTRAATYLKEWLQQNVLSRESEPAIYPYTIDYPVPYGEGPHDRLVLKGFMALLELEDFSKGGVLPHENTRAAAKSDRLNLMAACHSNFSPIFSLFSDEAGEVSNPIEQYISSTNPRFDFTDEEGCRQRLWAITDPAILSGVTKAMAPKPIFIADGHHRYETALNFQKKQAAGTTSSGPQPWDGVLMLFGRLEDPGLTVLPTHRVLKTTIPPLATIKTTLSDHFTIEEFPFDASNESAIRTQFLNALHERGQKGQAFGLALQQESRYVLLERKPESRSQDGSSPRDRLDVSILHSHILTPLSIPELTEERVIHTKDDHEAVELVRKGEAQGAFLLNATKVSEVSAVASAGERMPHKSTYFFPKPITGLVINVMEEGNT